MEHKIHRCEKEGCYICNAGLDYCEVCKEGEGGLKTECPGNALKCEIQHFKGSGADDLPFYDHQPTNGLAPLI